MINLWTELERERVRSAKQAREIARLREVLETTGIADAYRDGYAAALDTVNSIRVHVTTQIDPENPLAPSGGWIEPGKNMIVDTLEQGLAALRPDSNT